MVQKKNPGLPVANNSVTYSPVHPPILFLIPYIQTIAFHDSSLSIYHPKQYKFSSLNILFNDRFLTICLSSLRITKVYLRKPPELFCPIPQTCLKSGPTNNEGVSPQHLSVPHSFLLLSLLNAFFSPPLFACLLWISFDFVCG